MHARSFKYRGVEGANAATEKAANIAAKTKLSSIGYTELLSEIAQKI